MVSTIASALGTTGGINAESNKVIAFLNGNRTAEQMIQEYFGLRKEVVYSDDGTEVVDMINEFKDPEMLQKKKVRYNDYFASKGLTEEMFYKYVPRNLVYVETPTTNLIEDVTNITSTGVAKEEPVVSNTRGRPAKNTK
jgi:hypothetical protein